MGGDTEISAEARRARIIEIGLEDTALDDEAVIVGLQSEDVIVRGYRLRTAAVVPPGIDDEVLGKRNASPDMRIAGLGRQKIFDEIIFARDVAAEAGISPFLAGRSGEVLVVPSCAEGEPRPLPGL